jgi:hypothetical protein
MKKTSFQLSENLFLNLDLNQEPLPLGGKATLNNQDFQPGPASSAQKEPRRPLRNPAREGRHSRQGKRTSHLQLFYSQRSD